MGGDRVGAGVTIASTAPRLPHTSIAHSSAAGRGRVSRSLDVRIVIDQPRDDAGLVADLVQMPMAFADSSSRNLSDDCEHRRIHSIGGEQCGAGIEQARARHNGVGLRFAGRQRRAQRHVPGALFMAGVNDAKIVAGTLEGIKQVVVVDTGQRIDGIEPMREQRGNGGFAGGQVDRKGSGFFVRPFLDFGLGSDLLSGLGSGLAHGVSGYEASNVQIADRLSRATQFRD